jgi:short subunit fatty acids transporter
MKKVVFKNKKRRLNFESIKKALVFENIKKRLQVLFVKQNIFILFLIVVFVFIAFVLYIKTRRESVVEVEKTKIEEQIEELEFLRKESSYEPPTQEQIMQQIEELAEMRKSRGLN